MAGKFWFNRMVEHWTPPQRLDLVEHVRRARLQVVQSGNFGPQFYGLADDPEVDRSWVGMPLVGMRENLEYAAGLIARVKEAGACFVGQMSMSWHYGDHEKGRGLFGAWERIWRPQVLGEAPCARADEAMQRLAGGELRRWPIEGRPYFAYSGCMCNPHWLEMLKAMVRKAIELGVDGFNAHHNFEHFCRCAYCQQQARAFLREAFDRRELEALWGTGDLEQVEDVRAARPGGAPELKDRFVLVLEQAAQMQRKRAFDQVFAEYGRSLKPDLLLAQWYHKYDFRGQDERSLLPPELWARGEDYLWYSQGGHKGRSLLEHGYLADMGLPARFAYAAGNGRPFVINKYDYRRWRLSIAEAGAHRGAALAFHWSQDRDQGFALEDYSGPVIRYQRFLADQEDLVRPARPWAQVGLVYPRRSERTGEVDCLEPLKRIGRLLEDGHLLFEIVLDEQLEERLGDYQMAILPEVKRLSPGEVEALERFVARGGKLVLAGATDAPWPAKWGAGRVIRLAEGSWGTQSVEVEQGIRLPVYPLLEKDAFGRALLADIESLLGRVWLATDAPWFVRVRAWRVEQPAALVLHWVNYRQDEKAAIEVPWPVGPLRVECHLPEGHAAEKVEWRYPEMDKPQDLEAEIEGGRISFSIPSLIVYGLSVLYLRPEAGE